MITNTNTNNYSSKTQSFVIGMSFLVIFMINGLSIHDAFSLTNSPNITDYPSTPLDTNPEARSNLT